MTTPVNLREEGRLRVLQALCDTAGTSRPELVRLTGLSRATVSTLVADLVASGLVFEESGPADAENRSLGRPAQLLSLNPTAAYAVGADIGHAHVRVALCDLNGRPVWDHVEAADVDSAPQTTLRLVAELIHRALRECDVPSGGVLGLGLGIASPVAADGSLRADGIMTGWIDVRPGLELERRTGIPAQVINDANAGALAEHLYGAGRNIGDMVYVRLSAGIGAGIVTSGRLLLGSGGLAGEIGHLPAVDGGLICRCGNRGCLETVASPVAVARLLRESWGRPVTAAELPHLVKEDRVGVRRAVEDAGEAVGRTLANVVTVANPELLVVGGDLAAIGEPLFEPMRRAIARKALPGAAAQVRVVPGELGPSAEVRGAAGLVLARAPRALAVLSGVDPRDLPP